MQIELVIIYAAWKWKNNWDTLVSMCYVSMCYIWVDIYRIWTVVKSKAKHFLPGEENP